MSEKLNTVTVAHASFWYTKGDELAMAFRGDEIQVGGDDYDRGVRFGAFKSDEDEAATAAAPEGGGEPKPTTIDEIMAAVGDDKALAQEYLDAEEAADKPRSTLVEKLQAVVDAEA